MRCGVSRQQRLQCIPQQAGRSGPPLKRHFAKRVLFGLRDFDRKRFSSHGGSVVQICLLSTTWMTPLLPLVLYVRSPLPKGISMVVFVTRRYGFTAYSSSDHSTHNLKPKDCHRFDLGQQQAAWPQSGSRLCPLPTNPMALLHQSQGAADSDPPMCMEKPMIKSLRASSSSLHARAIRRSPLRAFNERLTPIRLEGASPRDQASSVSIPDLWVTGRAGCRSPRASVSSGILSGVGNFLFYISGRGLDGGGKTGIL